jgi:hypothetical protein
MHDTNPPDCPPWCESDHDGWTERSGTITKTCTRSRPAMHDLDGQPVTVTLERFADLDAGHVEVAEPQVTVEVHGALSPLAAVRLSRTLHDLAALAIAGPVRSGVVPRPSYGR